MGGALGVGDQAATESGEDLGNGGVEGLGSRSNAGGPRGQEEDGVVGGHAAVGVDAVDRTPRSRRQGALGGARFDDGVGGKNTQHGGHAGSEHAHALDPPADRPGAVSAGDRDRVLLGDGVGGHDRGRGVMTCPLGGGQRLRRDPGTLQKSRHVDRHTDHTGGADQDVPGVDAAQKTRNVLGRVGGVVRPPRPGAGIGRAGVENDSAGRPAAPLLPGDHAAGPDDGCGGESVGGEDSCGHIQRAVVDHQSQVGTAGGLEPGHYSSRPESLGSGHAHGATPSMMTPVVSGSPRARLRDCTAALAVPLPRLSMAHTMVATPAARS